MKNRVVILLMDSFGIGASKDAKDFGDVGADTLGSIVDYCATVRVKPLFLPNLYHRGLQCASELSRQKPLKHGLTDNQASPQALYGYATEISKGKDTPSGHWEMMGAPVMFDWHYFVARDEKEFCFPEVFMTRFISEAGLDQGVLDAGHASGTDVLRALGDEHCLSQKPIIYTSGDSVFQIAAHEIHFGLERLLHICKIARNILDDMRLNVGRVIARPFVGESSESYVRTGNRKDYSIPPPEKTLLDQIKAQGGEVVSIGKIADIFADCGITQKIKADKIDGLFDATLAALRQAESGTLIFTNFVDFDSSFGHRRDVVGYANALEEFDKRLPELDALLQTGDMVIVSADHGCDPTWKGTDHTREHVPVLIWGHGFPSGSIGARKTFADIGQTIAEFMGIPPLNIGKSCLPSSTGGEPSCSINKK